MQAGQAPQPWEAWTRSAMVDLAVDGDGAVDDLGLALLALFADLLFALVERVVVHVLGRDLDDDGLRAVHGADAVEHDLHAGLDGVGERDVEAVVGVEGDAAGGKQVADGFRGG